MRGLQESPHEHVQFVGVRLIVIQFFQFPYHLWRHQNKPIRPDHSTPKNN